MRGFSLILGFFLWADLLIFLGEDYSFFLKRIIVKIIDYLLETAFTILAMLQFIDKIFMKRGKMIISQKSKSKYSDPISPHPYLFL